MGAAARGELEGGEERLSLCAIVMLGTPGPLGVLQVRPLLRSPPPSPDEGVVLLSGSRPRHLLASRGPAPVPPPCGQDTRLGGNQLGAGVPE